MVEINVYSDIDTKESGLFMSMFGLEDDVFSADKVKKIFDENKSEKDFKFNIHSNGGSVSEGLAIYDIIRGSGKNIYTNIDGNCHSMAVILLLSAPYENRTANINARALIHNVRGYSEDFGTSQDFRELADLIDEEQNAILDIYEDRTTTDRETLTELMNSEKQLTANELLKYGFISKINSYNTNFFKTRQMNKKNDNSLGRVDKFLNSLKNFFEGENVEVKNFDFTDADGNVLFSTPKEDDSLAVGDEATPDGVFELPDGRTVTIEGGVVTDITLPGDNAEEMDNLRSENEELRNKLTEARELIVDLRNQITSNYQVKQRNKNPQSTNVKKTIDEVKTEVMEKRNAFKGRKGTK